MAPGCALSLTRLVLATPSFSTTRPSDSGHRPAPPVAVQARLYPLRLAPRRLPSSSSLSFFLCSSSLAEQSGRRSSPPKSFGFTSGLPPQKTNRCRQDLPHILASFPTYPHPTPHHHRRSSQPRAVGAAHSRLPSLR
ncbi:hypothetical protein GQ55_9G008900 [Panicum hallii var. hallii]|uniref:Uncharacterized protein n=1 Tax=Panicum hallii var. hallii TaxID=1504633 RepID=A0A2T7BY79_9POAL|nr:hypothetical protein GQ55_9G008900 [Panicum hallii var. hallii]